MSLQETQEDVWAQRMMSTLEAADAGGAVLPGPNAAMLAALKESSADAFMAVKPAGGLRLRLAAKWLLPLAALLMVMLAVGFWPGRSVKALAVDEVLGQLKGANTLVMMVRRVEKGETMGVYEVKYMAPDKMRTQQLSAGEGKAGRLEEIAVINGRKALRADPRTKLYLIRDASKQEMERTGNFARQITLPGNLGLDGGQAGQRLEMRSRGEDVLNGKRLRRVEVVRVTAAGDEPVSAGHKVELWCDDRGVPCRSRLEDFKAGRVIDTDIQVNPVLEASVFDLKAPEGYTDVKQGIFPRLPEDVKPIVNAYYKAREGITRYRMAVVNGDGKQRTGKWVTARQVRDGERWRLDEWDINVIKDPARYRFDDAAGIGFEALWERAGGVDVPVGMLVMTTNGQLAQVTYGRTTGKGTGSWLVPPMSAEISEQAYDEINRRQGQRWYRQAPREMVGSLAGNDLRELGWPRMVGDELIGHFGWDLGRRLPSYYKLADREDRKGLVGVRVIDGPDVGDYWMDPARDYLCVAYKRYSDKMLPWKDAPGTWDAEGYYAINKRKPSEPEHYEEGRVIEEFGQTHEGRWYPVLFGDGKLVRLETKGAIDPRFFEWPEGVVRPGAASEAMREMIGNSIEKRNTDWLKEQEIRQLTSRKLHAAVTACLRYAKENNGSWPADLETLVKLTYLKEEQIKAPRQGGKVFIYRIPKDKANILEIVLQEPAETWPAAMVASLGEGMYYADEMGQVIWVEKEEEFRKRGGTLK